MRKLKSRSTKNLKIRRDSKERVKQRSLPNLLQFPALFVYR